MSFWSRNGACSNNEHSHRSLRPGTRRTIGALTVLFAGAAVVQAQDAIPPGLIARLDITQQLEYSDNPDLEEEKESDFFGRTILGFGLESVTKLQRFALDLGTDIEEGRNDRSTFNFNNSFGRLDYTRATQNANIGLNMRYRESDVTSTFFDDDFDIDSSVINQSDGTRQSYGFALDGDFGINDPIGGAYSLGYSEIRYEDTTDPDLTDQDLLDFSGQLNFRIDPRILARVTAGYSDFNTNGDGVDRETTRLGAGVQLLVNPTLTADIGLSYDSIERSGDETGEDDGISAAVSFEQQMSNGTLGLDFESDVTSNDDGRRGFLSVSRQLQLSRTTALDMSLGATYSEGVGTDPLFNIDYVQELSTSRLSFGVSQSVDIDSDNEERINTSLRAGYDYSINALSSIGVDLAFFNRNELGDNADDGQRVDLGLVYRHALTRDWDLIGSYRHTFEDSDNDSSRNSNTIFVGLQRGFTWSP